MILRYLSAVVIICCCTEFILCLPSGSKEPERDRDSKDDQEEESTTTSDNSFPQSRLETVDVVGDDAMIRIPSLTADNSDKNSNSWSTEFDDFDNVEEQDKKGHKKGPKRKKKKNNPLQKFLPLLLIPFLIQTKIIPLFLFNLKIIAFKALMVGKLAMILIAFNMVRNMLVTNNAHVDHVDTKYSMDHLAQDHYGYNGGTEYGAWVNKRHDPSGLAYKQWEHTTPKATSWKSK